MATDYEDIYLPRPGDGEDEAAAHIKKLEKKYNTNSAIISAKIDAIIGALFLDAEEEMWAIQLSREYQERYGREATSVEAAPIIRLFASDQLRAELDRRENIHVPSPRGRGLG